MTSRDEALNALPPTFLARVTIGGPNECWPWTPPYDGKGYGQFNFEKRRYPAHRFAYERLVGPVPDGLPLDHLCRNRACVNPAHLEPVTHRENVLRGVGVTAINAAKTECSAGHPFNDENTYIDPRTGRRACRPCRRAWWAKRAQKLSTGLDVERLRESMVEVMEQRGLGGGGLQPIDAVAIAKVYGGPIRVASTTGLDAALAALDRTWGTPPEDDDLLDPDIRRFIAATRAALATPQEKPAVAERTDE